MSSVAAAGAVSAVAVILYMRMPARWLCEFDELPSELHMPGMRGSWAGTAQYAVFAVVFCAALIGFGGGVSITKCAAVCCLLAAALSDAEYMIIPDQLLVIVLAAAFLSAAGEGVAEQFSADSLQCLVGLPAGGGSAELTCGSDFFRATAASAAGGVRDAAAGAACCGALALISSLCAASGKSAIGAGDIKMLTVCGALSGAPGRAALIFSASVLFSAAFISFGIILKKIRPSSFIPMAPFITLATVLFI